MTGPPALRVIEGGDGGAAPRPMTRALELAALGAGLTLIAALMGRLPDWRAHLDRFQALFAVAAAFYVLACSRLGRYASLPGAGVAVFIIALATRLALLSAPPSLSDDVYRYVWEGRVLIHGGNPYAQAPGDTALAALRDARIYPRVNHPELATIYPPLAEAGFALVAAASPTVTAMKLWVLLHDLALVAVLAGLLRRRGLPAAGVLLYAWNPLVIVEYAGAGHHDPAGMLWLALALLLAEDRPLGSAVALAVGGLVKLAPLLALPFLWRRWPWRARIAAIALLAAGLGVYGWATRGAASGLRAYWSTWRNNQLLFELFERWTGRFESARLIALAVVAATVGYALWKGWDAMRGTRAALKAGLLAGPVAHPWYFGWYLALEPAAPTPPWLLLSLMAVMSYGLLRPPAEGSAFHLPLAWRVLEYGVPALLAITLATRRRFRES